MGMYMLYQLSYQLSDHNCLDLFVKQFFEIFGFS